MRPVRKPKKVKLTERRKAAERRKAIKAAIQELGARERRKYHRRMVDRILKGETGNAKR